MKVCVDNYIFVSWNRVTYRSELHDGIRV